MNKTISSQHKQLNYSLFYVPHCGMYVPQWGIYVPQWGTYIPQCGTQNRYLFLQNYNSFSEYFMTTVISHSLLLSTYHNNTQFFRAYARTRTHYKFSISSITSITNGFKYHIIKHLSSDRRCDSSDRRCAKSDRRKAFLLRNHAKLTYFHLIFPSFQYFTVLIRT